MGYRKTALHAWDPNAKEGVGDVARVEIGAFQPQYIVKMDYDGDDNMIYHGQAVPGTAESDSLWQIRKFTYVAGNLTEVLWAGGARTFTNAWDDRVSLSYS